MAKYKTRNSSGTAGKVVAGILAGILACTAAFGLGWGITGTPDLTKWGKHEVKPPIDGDIGDNDNNNGEIITGADGAVVSEGKGNGIALLSAKLPVEAYEANGISPLADTAFTLTATITPAEAENKQVDYSISWKNSSSTWASGKNISDYLVIAQSTNGGLTATLTCKQAFGEQAIVTVVSRDNPDATATCTVDYRKRVTNIPLSMAWNNSNYGSTTPTVFSTSETVTSAFLGSPVIANIFPQWGNLTSSIFNHSFGFETGIGTIETQKEGWSLPTIEVAATSAYLTALKNAGYTTIATAEQFKSASYAGYDEMFVDKFVSDFPSNLTKYNNLKKALQSQTSTDMVRVRISSRSNGGDGATYTKTYNVRFSSASLTMSVTNVSLGNTSVII